MQSEIRIKLGELIRLERERQQIDVEQMADRLKITEANLGSIERGDSAALPSEVYFELFSKGYCEALGIDYARTIDAIGASIEEDSLKIGTGKKKDGDRKDGDVADAVSDDTPEAVQNRDFVKKGLILFGVIVAAFVVFLVSSTLFCSDDGPVDSSSMDQPDMVVHEEAVAEEHSGNTESEADKFNWNVDEYQAPKKLTLEIVAHQSSWSAIFADGDTAIYRNLVPGRTYNVEADYRMVVSVGIPRSVDIKLNGQPVDLTDPSTGRIARVRIDQTNVQDFLTRDREPVLDQADPAATDANWQEFENSNPQPTDTSGTETGEADES